MNKTKLFSYLLLVALLVPLIATLIPVPEVKAATFIPFGLSGYPKSTSVIDDVIDIMTEYNMNTYRMSFNPEWFGSKTNPYTASFITYFLANTPSDWVLVIDRNHLYPPDSASAAALRTNIATARASLLEICATWGNNSRVWLELFNEYIDSDYATQRQYLTDEIRDAGYNNTILCNKWNTGWSTAVDQYDTPPQWTGYHFYFNAWSPSGALTQMGYATAYDIGGVLNTEIGAHYSEYTYFTTALVAEVNEFLYESYQMGVGNCIWMNQGVTNWAYYESYGIDLSFLPVNPPSSGSIFDDGFESGDFTEWDGTPVVSTGEVGSITTTSPNSGTYAYNATGNGSGTYEYVRLNLTLTDATNVLYSRAYFNFTTSLTEGDYYIMDQRVGSTDLLRVYIQGASGAKSWKLQYKSGTTTYWTTANGSVSLNTWYCVEIASVVDATSGTYKLWIDGVLTISLTAKNSAAYGNIDNVRLGMTSKNLATAATVTVDDVELSTLYVGLLDTSLSFVDGFETGDFSLWDGSPSVTSGETGTVSSADARNGTYSFLAEANGGAADEYVRLTKTLDTNTSIIYTRIYVKFITNLTDNDYFISSHMAGATELNRIYIGNAASAKTWKFQYKSGTTTTYSGTIASGVTLNTWYCIEIATFVDATTGFYKVWINGTSIYNRTNYNTAAYGDISAFRFGMIVKTEATASALYIDNVEASENYIGTTGYVPDTEIALYVNSPTATQYGTSYVTVNLTVVTTSPDVTWYNIKNASVWVYGSNQTYTTEENATGLITGTYTLYAWANNTDGYSDEKTVTFTIALVTITITYPTNTTYTTSSVTVGFSATGGTIDTRWYNVYDGAAWKYTLNQTFTTTTTMTGFTNGTYTFYAWANNTVADTDEATESFTVTIAASSIFDYGEGWNDPLFQYIIDFDLVGFTFAAYVSVIGSLAFGIPVLFISAVLYIRQKSLFIVSMVWLLVGAGFISAMSELGFIAVAFISFGVAGVLVQLILTWRKQ